MIKAQDFNRAGLLTVQWIRELPILLGVLFLLNFASGQYFEYLGQELNSSELGPWPAQIGEFLAGLILGFALLMIGGFFLVGLRRKMTWGEFFKRFTAPLTAESLRAITQILLWSLVFVIPGVIMYCRLNFVPFVIFCDPDYEQHPDAVGRCKQLTKKCWFRVTLLILVFSIFDAVFELAPNLLRVENLFARGFFSLCSFVFSLFAFVLLYMIFENLRKVQEAHSSERTNIQEQK